MQFPLHAAVVAPATPQVPAGQGAVHRLEGRAGEEPNNPALQFVQLLAPAGLNLPAGHIDAVLDTDPTTQKNPAVQGPEQALDGRAAVAPYRPALQFVHTPDPAALKVPGLHMLVVGDIDPAGHAYPAVQLPEHSDDARPDVAPYLPASHGPLQLAVTSPAVDPYSPALQFVHTPAPGPLYVPSGHSNAVGDTDPAAHAYPAVQIPEHDKDVRPGLLPKSPAAQSLQTPAPAKLYLPAGHMDAVADTDPGGQAYPAVQFPVQADDVKPGLLPNVPAGHRAVQALELSPEMDPKVPALQLVQAAAPASLYCPGSQMTAVGEVEPATHAYPAVQFPLHPAVGSPDDAPYRPAAHTLHTPDPPTLYQPGLHTTAVALVEPAGHAYPALQFPTHVGDATPDTSPNRPAGHTPVQVGVVRPDVDPYRPALQFVHTPAPARLYVPGGHSRATGEVEFAGHAYPAVQFPLHAGVVRPEVAPYVPAGHAPVHAFVLKPDDAPYSPALQFVHTPDPLRLKVPAVHLVVVAFVEPGGHI